MTLRLGFQDWREGLRKQYLSRSANAIHSLNNTTISIFCLAHTTIEYENKAKPNCCSSAASSDIHTFHSGFKTYSGSFIRNMSVGNPFTEHVLPQHTLLYSGKGRQRRPHRCSAAAAKGCGLHWLQSVTPGNSGQFCMRAPSLASVVQYFQLYIFLLRLVYLN